MPSDFHPIWQQAAAVEDWSVARETNNSGLIRYRFTPANREGSQQIVYEITKTVSLHNLLLSCTAQQDGVECQVQVGLPKTGWDYDPDVTMQPTTASSQDPSDGNWQTTIQRKLGPGGEQGMWICHDEQYFIQDMFIPHRLWPHVMSLSPEGEQPHTEVL